MNVGWSIKDGGAVLGVHPNKFPQAYAPAIRKVAMLMLADPLKTVIDLRVAMEQVAAEDDQRLRTPSAETPKSRVPLTTSNGH